MGSQRALFVEPPRKRKPSATAAGTRARRHLAREWIAAHGLKTWRSGDGSAHPWCHNCDHEMCKDGAYVPRPGGGTLAICLDCIPYDGAWLRSFEWWDCSKHTDPCTRCLRSMRDRGGMYQRGGPFCWECGTPPREQHEAWLLALRTAPETPPPWAGDRDVNRARAALLGLLYHRLDESTTHLSGLRAGLSRILGIDSARQVQP